MLIRIEGHDLPGGSCNPAPDFPDGHHNIHVALQGRKGPGDLHGMARADADSVTWELPCEVVSPPPIADLRGPHIQGRPGRRFIYISWGVVDGGHFRMFRRAKLALDAVPGPVMSAACETGRLLGRVGLTDQKGQPACAGIAVDWSALPAR